MKKRIFTLLLALLLLIAACPAALADDAAPWAGDGTSGQPYQLPDIAALTALRDSVNAGNSYSGVYFKMTGDIALPADWTPIGTEASPFSGIFDGGNKLLTVAEGGRCLFNYVNGFTVQNLNIYGPRIEGNGLVDNLTRSVGYGAIDHVTLKSGTQTLKAGFLGGLGSGDTVNTIALTSMTQTFTISNCTAEGGVVIGYNKDQDCIGSFCGRANVIMTNCVSSAQVYGVERVGGLIGTKDNAMGEFSVKNSAFHGSVTASGEYCGGIVGVGYTHETAPNTLCMVIENCSCDGVVTGTSYVGGITGGEGGLWQAWDNGIGRITGCSFTGTVSGTSCVGGLIGYMRGLDKYNIFKNNYFSPGCGASRGLGGAMYVDSSIYADGENKPLGWQEVEGWGQVYCFDSSEDSLARIKYDLNPSSSYYNIAKTDHNRDDDPLGEDGWKLFGGQPSPASSKKVKFTVLGDELHDMAEGDTGHGLWVGGLTTWLPETEYTIGKNDKVYDLIEQAIDADPSLTMYARWTQQFESYYIYAVEYNGLKLTEKDNWKNSGWMVTVNGRHVQVGVSNMTLADGDEVILHWCDDFYIDEAEGARQAFLAAKPDVKAENAKNGKIKLTWEDIENAMLYRVFVSEAEDGEYTLAAEVEEPTYTHGGTMGKKYWFKVQAVSFTDLESQTSDPVAKFRVPAQVTSLKATSKGGQVTLKWKKVSGAKKYEIYMSKNGKTGWKKVGTATKNTFIYKKGKAGQKLYFRVRAVTSNGKKGEYSKNVSIKVKK